MEEMFEHFTEEEIDRMAAFCETPVYKRDPKQLLPDGHEDGGETESTGSTRPDR